MGSFGSNLLTYEYPLNERVRTLLRLEDLFDRTKLFLDRETPVDHHVCLVTIFEILEVASRGDLKSELLQELDRQRAYLEALRNNPAISEERLSTVLRSIETAFSTLIAVAGKTGQHLRENEWLMAIKQRSAIPGGVCEFDLPSYHHWLNREVTTRRADLMVWLQPLLPVAAALRIVLRVLRESGKSTKLVANQGVFQQMPMERAAHMLRLTLSADLACVPEISANKYALNVRFIQPATVQRSKVFESDVSFELVYCNL